MEVAGLSLFLENNGKRRSGAWERGTAEGHSVLCSHEHFRTCEEPEPFHNIPKILLLPFKTGFHSFQGAKPNQITALRAPFFWVHAEGNDLASL